MDFLNKFPGQIIKVYSAMPPKKRAFSVITILLTVGTLVGLIMWANRIDYKSLYTGLSSEDAGMVLNNLQQMKVPYKVGIDGTTIMVPAASVYELRMEMAGKGLPQNSAIGYEIFDKQSIGATEFIQKVNYKRALQGELSRTISQLREIKSSRVHLTLPEKTLFAAEQEKTSASIVLNLYPGRLLRENQIQGVIHLVASSVEGLSPDNVIIVDFNGKLLAGGSEKAGYSGLDMSQQELRLTMERKIQRKIETLLSEVVGSDSVTARVSLEMDFTRSEKTEEMFDPDKVAVRSEQRSDEKSSGKRSAASGVPGVMSNTPDLQEAEDSAVGVKTVDYKKSDETINFEISHFTKKTINSVGDIKKMSVAVLVDGTYQAVKDKDGNEVRKYIPRPDDEIAKYNVLVKKTVGYDEDRGDSVEVVNIQFQETVSEVESVTDRLMQQIDWQSMITYMVTAIIFALFFVFGLKPLLSTLSKTVESAEIAAALPQGSTGSPGAVAGGTATPDELPPGIRGDDAQLGTKETQLVNFAESNPKLFAQYIKNWLQ